MKIIYEHFMTYVEDRLTQWAEWYSRGNWYNLGYPSCSTEYRLMTEGNISKNTGPRPLACNKEAEEIEELIKEMKNYNINMAIAIRCHYFTNGGLRAKAEKIKISHVQFKNYVDMAHQWIAGRLSARRCQ